LRRGIESKRKNLVMFMHNRDMVDVFGFGRGCVADQIQRVRYLKHVADAGNSYVENQFGRSFRFGLGIAKDVFRGADYLDRLAKARNAVGENNFS
jgi:hypothetical protein